MQHDERNIMWLKGELIDSRLHQISVFCNIIDVSGGVTKVDLTTKVLLTKGFSMT